MKPEGRRARATSSHACGCAIWGLVCQPRLRACPRLPCNHHETSTCADHAALGAQKGVGAAEGAPAHRGGPRGSRGGEVGDG